MTKVQPDLPHATHALDLRYVIFRHLPKRKFPGMMPLTTCGHADEWTGTGRTFASCADVLGRFPQNACKLYCLVEPSPACTRQVGTRRVKSWPAAKRK